MNVLYDVRWSILILTQPSRARFLARLLAVLKPQVEQHGDIEILREFFDKTTDLGGNRQRMMDNAKGRYLNFIDDDDLVPANYVDRIYPLLDGVVDYVGFRLQMFIDNQKQQPTFHSLRYKEWNGDSAGWYRDISHVNPIRRDLAVSVRMSGGTGEDHRWADALRAKNIVKTEHFIEEIMYLYYFRSNKNEPAPAGHPAEIQQENRPVCVKCRSSACGIAGGMRRCNQCGYSWI